MIPSTPRHSRRALLPTASKGGEKKGERQTEGEVEKENSHHCPVEGAAAGGSEAQASWGHDWCPDEVCPSSGVQDPEGRQQKRRVELGLILPFPLSSSSMPSPPT